MTNCEGTALDRHADSYMDTHEDILLCVALTALECIEWVIWQLNCDKGTTIRYDIGHRCCKNHYPIVK